MFNPPYSHQNPGSYFDLQKRVLQHVQSAKIEDQILTIVRTACEQALESENLILSRAENKRLLAQVLKSVLEGMRKQLDEGSKSV